MKKILWKAREKLRDYWQRSMTHSQNVKMSRGAQFVDKIITFAHGDNWRRNHDKKHTNKK